MNARYLTITLRPNWKSELRETTEVSAKTQYQGEVLNFETTA